MPPTDFLLFCEFVICWNNEEMLQEQCSNISVFLVQYEQLTILDNEPTHALPYIVSRKPTLNIH